MFLSIALVFLGVVLGLALAHIYNRGAFIGLSLGLILGSVWMLGVELIINPQLEREWQIQETPIDVLVSRL